MRRTLPLALFLLLGAASCGDMTVKAGDIEPQIADKVESAVGRSVEVSCPDDVEAKKGAKFDCDVSAEDKTKATAAVTITSFDEDADPPVKSNFNVPIIPTKALETDAAKQLGPQIGTITVQCPTLIPVSDDLDVQCPITEPASADGVVVDVSGPPNALKYRTVKAG